LQKKHWKIYVMVVAATCETSSNSAFLGMLPRVA